MIRALLPVIALAILVSPATAAAPAFVAVASGSLGAITAQDGDSAFDATYRSASGDTRVTRLEASVGSGPLPPALTHGYSARWTASLTPTKSGSFPISLRATEPATVRVDGRIVLRQRRSGAAFDARTIARLTMVAGRAHEFAIDFTSPGPGGRIALEWAAPSPADASAAPAALPERLVAPPPGTLLGAPAHLENGDYTLDAHADGTFIITQKATQASATFSPRFAVVVRPPDHATTFAGKGGKFENDGPVGKTNYQVPAWDKETDYLAAAQPRTRMDPVAMAAHDGTVTWRFDAQPQYTLSAALALPDHGEPRLTWRLRAAAAGQYSVGYVGAPAVAMNDAGWIWQPLVWQDRRFPNRSYLTLEYECPLPFTLAAHGGTVVGVGADPREMPYRMPTYDDSRFGVLVRNAAGEAQPQLFAPVLGGFGSSLRAGAEQSFSVRLLVTRGAWFDAYKALAQSLYEFSDYRESTSRSLNTTIENLADFVLNDRYCYWYPRYKTWGYQNDGGAGAGRQQSAADAVSLALVLDSRALLDRRARPTLEYMLSRHSLMTNFNRPDFMGGCIDNACDLTAAYRLTGERTTVIRELFARDQAGRRHPSNAILAARYELMADLTRYRLTNDAGALADARRAADRYIAARIGRPAADFHDLASSFWTDMAPAYDLLYEVYQRTGEHRYLDAATAAMREFTAYEYLVPVIPAGDFTANPGGVYNHQPVPEEIVPAWQVSANGLAPECAATAHSHRGVFMASYAAWMLRLARDAHEPFFRDIGRSAVVGRYANYPSYAYRNGYTTLHQKADYPLRPFEEIKKFTSAHYNHPLPMTAFLVDYLVADAYARSDGHISFPSEYTNTGAYFRNEVYGAAGGRFYDDTGAYLWLPKQLVTIDSVQVNYVAARGNGRLYLAFTNQAPRAVTARFAVDAARVALAGSHHARVWIDNAAGPAIELVDGRGTVQLAPKGITCLAIDDAVARTDIQDAMLDPASPPLPAGSTCTVQTSFGEVTATALRFGRGLTSVHVWLTAGPAAVRRADLVYSDHGVEQRLTCPAYPFEFTVPVADATARFAGRIEAETPGGRVTSPPLALDLRAR